MVKLQPPGQHGGRWGQSNDEELVPVFSGTSFGKPKLRATIGARAFKSRAEPSLPWPALAGSMLGGSGFNAHSHGPVQKADRPKSSFNYFPSRPFTDQPLPRIREGPLRLAPGRSRMPLIGSCADATVPAPCPDILVSEPVLVRPAHPPYPPATRFAENCCLGSGPVSP